MELMSDLRSIIALIEDGRLNAARAKWNSLPEQFRIAVLRFAIAITQHDLDSLDKIEMDSDYGPFTLDKSFCLGVLRVAYSMS